MTDPLAALVERELSRSRPRPNPADLASGRRRILADELPCGRPQEPRRSTPPSPAKAAAYRRTERMENAAIFTACFLIAFGATLLVCF